MKEWILRYAEQSEDQSSEDDEIKDTSVFNPELEEKFDPVSFTQSGLHITSLLHQQLPVSSHAVPAE